MGCPTCLVNLCLNFQLQVDILQRRHGNAVRNHAQVGMGVKVGEQAWRQEGAHCLPCANGLVLLTGPPASQDALHT